MRQRGERDWTDVGWTVGLPGSGGTVVTRARAVSGRAAVATVALGMVTALCVACTPSTAPASGWGASPSSQSGTGDTTQPASGEGVGTSSTPSPGTPPGDDPLRGWSLEQQVGQLFMVGVDVHQQQDASWAAVRDRHVGNVFLAGRSAAAPDHVLALVRSFTDLVRQDTTHDTAMLVATDQEGGAVQVLQGPGFSRMPSALDQSVMPVGDLESAATGWGSQLASAGINLNLAPVMDLVDGDPAENPPIGKWGREYGSSADQVVAHANAFSRGMRSAGVAVAVKHFPGLGRVTGNTDTTAGVTDTLTSRDDASVGVFARGIEDGAEMVMMSTAVYERIDPDAPAAFSSVVVDDVLRGDLGFHGVVITDDVSAAVQVQAWTPGERAVKAIGAGCDIVLVSASPEQAAEMVDAVVARAQEDPVFAEKVHAAATRVLALKGDMPVAP